MTTIKVFCARSMTVAVSELAGGFMRESGHQVDITFGPVGTLAAKLAAGETTDVLILGQPAMAMMEQKGAFVAGTRTDVEQAKFCLGQLGRSLPLAARRRRRQTRTRQT